MTQYARHEPEAAAASTAMLTAPESPRKRPPPGMSRREVRLVITVRLVLVVGCSALLLASDRDRVDVVTVVLLTGVAAAASVSVPWHALRRLQSSLEAVLACSVMLLVEPLPEGAR